MQCPMCGRPIIESDRSYACDCVTIPKTFLHREITPEIAQALITNRRTKTLDGFISNRNGKKFSAALVIRNKKVGFEFKEAVNIRVHSENSGTAHVTIKGAMYKEFKISYGHVSSRMAENLACITAANLVKHNLKGAASVELDISINNLDFSRYILKERTPRDKEIKAALEYLFATLGEFRKWSARYKLEKRPRLTGSPQSNDFPVGVFPNLNADVTEENGRLRVVLPGGPDIQSQFKASLQRAVPDGERTYILPATVKPALMAWIKSVKKEGRRGYGTSSTNK